MHLCRGLSFCSFFPFLVLPFPLFALVVFRHLFASLFLLCPPLSCRCPELIVNPLQYLFRMNLTSVIILGPMLRSFLVTFGTIFGHFWDHLGTPWEALGDPKVARAPERAPAKDYKNEPFSSPPGWGSGALSRRREHSFHYFRRATFWTPFWHRIGTPLGPMGATMLAQGGQGGHRGVQRELQRGSFSDIYKVEVHPGLEVMRSG